MNEFKKQWKTVGVTTKTIGTCFVFYFAAKTLGHHG